MRASYIETRRVGVRGGLGGGGTVWVGYEGDRGV